MIEDDEDYKELLSKFDAMSLAELSNLRGGIRIVNYACIIVGISLLLAGLMNGLVFMFVALFISYFLGHISVISDTCITEITRRLEKR